MPIDLRVPGLLAKPPASALYSAGHTERAMSFLKSLFGRKEAKPAGPAGPLKSIEYKGFTIHATPFAEGGQQLILTETRRLPGQDKTVNIKMVFDLEK